MIQKVKDASDNSNCLKTKEHPKKQRDECAIAERTRIKERLRSAHISSRLNINQIRNILEEPQFGGCRFSYNTIDRTIYDDWTMDINVVLSLCRLWNINYDEMFELPNGQSETDGIVFDPGRSISKSGVLLDKSYIHTYSGYMFSRNEKSDSITRIILDIDDGEGCPVATLKCLSESSIGNSVNRRSVEYIGIPKVIGNEGKAVFIDFSNASGSYMHIYFNYQAYQSQQMYFRKGFVVMCGAHYAKPTIQHCLLFFGGAEPPIDKDVVKGLLRMDQRSFTIPDRTVNEMIVDPRIADFFEKFSRKIDKEDVYRIDEEDIIKAASDHGRYSAGSPQISETIEVLMRIKAYADSTARITVFDDTETAKFAKQFIQ